MYQPTQGIVIHSLPYAEKNLIVKIYTKLFGMQTYMVRGVRGGKARFRNSYFQPLNVLELQVTHRQKHAFHSIKDIRISRPFSSIPDSIEKKSIVFFLNEILYKTIREEETNAPLYSFIHDFIYQLDEWQGSVSLYPQYFLVQLSRHLGFFPLGEHSGSKPYFDLQEGCFTERLPSHGFCLDQSLSEYLFRLMSATPGKVQDITVSREERKVLLQKLIRFYEFHFQNLREIQTHTVLEGVFQS